MKSSENMEKILEYIDAHLEEDLTIGQLADEAGYSQYHFMRRFKAHTGMSAGKYLCPVSYTHLDREKWIVSYHEIGHALVAAKQTNSAPVQKITLSLIHILWTG